MTNTLRDMTERERSQISTGWKDIKLKIFGTEESIILPVMISSRASDVKNLLAEMHGGVAPHQIELVYKVGPSYRRHRNGDEVQTNLLVKGIKGFAKGVFEWPHPHCIIGAGHMGLRQALHYERNKLTYQLFERKDSVGGNAWRGIANRTSKLQTEGPQYQLQYDIYDGNLQGLLGLEQYGYWPSRDEIIAHFELVANQYGLTPNIRLNTEVIQMTIQDTPGGDIRLKSYDWTFKNVQNPEDWGVFKSSYLIYYPGCLVVPHRKTWAGEDVFGAQIGYGFAHEFDYTKVDGQDGVIIGMGAFAHENIRTYVEHGGRKAYNIARHFNLLMPRLVCWWINQSVCPPTAAMVLHQMQPMYDIIGMNPWNFFSVTSNPERTVATIKQYTRWGISDIFFLCIYYDKAEIINAEIKRMKPRAAVLNNGRVLENIDHMVKVIGFDGDFGVDQLMQSTRNVGPWPDGDFRRWTLSDQSAIDASRFTNIAISPAVSSLSNMTTWYSQHPEASFAVLGCGMIPENHSEPELGSPCYHWEPRAGTAMMMVVGGFAPDLSKFEELNSAMKKGSHHLLAHPRAYVQAIERDWYCYCKMFRDQGYTIKTPAYPYSIKDAYKMVHAEDDLRRLEEQKWMKRMGMEAGPQQTQEMAPQEEDPAAMIARQQAEAKAREEMAFSMDAFMPGDHVSFEPARKVLQARIRSMSPAKDKKELDSWLQQGHEVKDFLVKSTRGRSPPALRY